MAVCGQCMGQNPEESLARKKLYYLIVLSAIFTNRWDHKNKGSEEELGEIIRDTLGFQLRKSCRGVEELREDPWPSRHSAKKDWEWQQERTEIFLQGSELRKTSSRAEKLRIRALKQYLLVEKVLVLPSKYLKPMVN